MDNVVIYARFSSSRQREESIEAQVRECQAYAKQHDYNVLKVYADRAISGRSDERPEFQLMLEDSAKQQFRYVLVYTFDRFSRNKYSNAVYKQKLKKNGVRVLSIKEQVDDSPVGVLMESIFEGFAEYYSLELAQKVKRGMKQSALKGMWPSGNPPFGYMLNKEHRIVPNPDTVEILKNVFDMAVIGERFTTIAAYLNGLGCKPPNGTTGKYRYDTVARLLANPIVIGKFQWDDVVIDNYPGVNVIDYGVFQAVQDRLNSRKRKGVVNVMKSEEYMLTPKIFCGNCGAPMNGVCGVSSKGKKYYYYRCTNTLKGKSCCDLPPIPRGDLEAEIHKMIVAILNNTENVKTIAREAMDILTSDDDTELLAMRKRLTQAKAESKKAAQAVLDGFYTDALRDAANALQTEITNLEVEIAKRSIEITDVPITQDMIEWYLRKMSKESKKELFDSMIQRVEVNKKDDDENYSVTVMMNYTPTATVKNTVSGIVRNNNKLVGPVVITANYLMFTILIPRKHIKRKAR